VGVCLYEICNVWMCVRVGFVMCGCVYVWVCACMGFVTCGCVCVGFLIVVVCLYGFCHV
jgi:hypothetical protein